MPDLTRKQFIARAKAIVPNKNDVLSWMQTTSFGTAYTREEAEEMVTRDAEFESYWKDDGAPCPYPTRDVLNACRKHYGNAVNAETIQARVDALVRDMPKDHIAEDGIWIDALRAIAEGAPDAATIARIALKTIKRGAQQGWERHYA